MAVRHPPPHGGVFDALRLPDHGAEARLRVLQELGWWALLHAAAVAEDEDDVAVEHRVDAMSDHDERTPAERGGRTDGRLDEPVLINCSLVVG